MYFCINILTYLFLELHLKYVIIIKRLFINVELIKSTLKITGDLYGKTYFCNGKLFRSHL